jgi:hypothetical protein
MFAILCWLYTSEAPNRWETFLWASNIIKDLLRQRLYKRGNYAVVEESGVFRAVCRPATVTMQRWGKHVSRCQATAINTWMTQEWGGVTWPRQQWRNNRSTAARSVSRVSDQRFIGETEARSRAVLGGRQPWKVRSWRRIDVWLEGLIHVEYLEWETVVVSLLRAVTRRWLVETGSPSAIALYWV